MVNADSKEGTTVSGLFDGGKNGVGGGVVAGQEKEGLTFVGEGAGVVLGVGSNGVSVGEFVGFDFGHYAGVGDGAYISISRRWVTAIIARRECHGLLECHRGNFNWGDIALRSHKRRTLFYGQTHGLI